MTVRPISRPVLIGALALTATLWGSSFLVMKGLAQTLGPLQIAGARGLVAAATLCLFFLATGRSLRFRRADLTPAMVMGTLHGWLPNALTAYAVAGLGAGFAAMMQSASPLVTAGLASALLSSERLRSTQWLGVLAGFAGVALLIGPEAISGASATLGPVCAMAATALCYGFGNVWARGRRDIPPERLALGHQSFSGLVGLSLSILLEPTPPLSAFGALWAPLLIFGALQSALPFTLFLWLIQRAGPVKATMAGYLTPMVAAGLAAALLGEAIAPRQLVAAGIILAGVALAARR
jgi:drug/metabolite transporter (DMT)-like permease